MSDMEVRRRRDGALLGIAELVKAKGDLYRVFPRLRRLPLTRDPFQATMADVENVIVRFELLCWNSGEGTTYEQWAAVVDREEDCDVLPNFRRMHGNWNIQQFPTGGRSP